MPRLLGNRLQIGPLQVAGDLLVELPLGLIRGEVLRNGIAIGEVNAAFLLYLFTQGAVAQRINALLEVVQCVAALLPVNVQAAKRLGVAKVMRVDHAGQTIQLHQVVLDWRGRQQHPRFGARSGAHDVLGAFVAFGVIDVTQLVRFIKHHQMPINQPYPISLRGHVLVRANDNMVWLIKGVDAAQLALLARDLAVDNDRRQLELVD